MFGLPAWEIGAVANAAIAACYFTICWLIVRGLIQTGQLRTNRLAGATALIFFTCAVHHGGHTVHVLLPLVGADPAGLAMRRAFTWPMDVWDIFGAAVAIGYLSLRSSYGRLLQTPAMFHDLERERVQAVVAAERAALAEAQAVAKLGSWSLVLPDGVLQVSDEYRRLFGFGAEDVVPGATAELVHPADRDRVRAASRRLTEDGQPLDEMFRVRVPGREEAILQVCGRIEIDAETGARRATGTVQDITDRVRSEQARQSAEERFRVAFEQAGVPMAMIGLDGEQRGRVLDANAAYASLLGLPEAEIVDRHLERWLHPEDVDAALETPLARLASGASRRVQFERRYLDAEGQTISTLITDAVISDPDHGQVLIEQALDISERKRFEGKLRYLADHDALTGLFNRRRFEEELTRALAHARRYGGGGAVMALDLDGFKYVNDTLGHAMGDSLVTRLASTLQRSLRETDVVARTGGDEFAVILPGASERDAGLVAEKLLSDIRRTGTMVDGERHAQVTTSIGITLFAAAEELLSEDLLVEADIAMYDAKHAGKDRYAVYRRGEQRRERIAARQDWLSRLRQCVEDERFVLWAQPIVPICSNGIPRYELLLRMPTDDGDMISPGAFLYNAERFGMVEEIDLWVLEQAAKLLAAHQRAGTDLALSVNMSPKTLNTGRPVKHLERLLSEHDVPPGRLVVEITETAAISNMELARELARGLRELDARIALDDFGAGFATFYYLKHLEFDYVKIDGEFIRHLPDNRADQLVVKSVVDIARGLGADTIAEFVQDDRTIELLRGFQVGYAQGYHTGRPGPIEAVLPRLLGPQPV